MAQPSAAVQTMLSDGLVRIHEANPQMTIVAIIDVLSKIAPVNLV